MRHGDVPRIRGKRLLTAYRVLRGRVQGTTRASSLFVLQFSQVVYGSVEQAPTYIHPDREPMKTTVPDFLGLMWGKNARLTLSGPNTFVLG